MKSSNVEALLGAGLLIGAFILGAAACNKTSSSPYVVSLPSFSNQLVTPLGEKVPGKSITKLDIDPKRVVFITGEINEGNDVTIQQLRTLGQSEEPIYLILKSPGGSVLEGAMIISALEAAKGPVYTICDTICASMAAMIFEHGTGRYMVDRSFVMFHPASGGAEGEIDKMVSRLNSIQKYIGKMEAYIANRANITFEEYKKRSGIELWIDAEDAVNNHFADALVSYVLPANAFVGVLSNNKNNTDTVVGLPSITIEPSTSILGLTWSVK